MAVASPPALAPMFAIVGCDGSGKSTVSAELLAWIRRYGPAETAHLGQQSGDLGRAIGRLPLIGARLDRLLTSKAGRARDTTDKIPDAATALVIYLFTRRRVRRFRRMLALRRRGVIVVTDRYPQTVVPGFFDGPGLSAAAPGSAFVRMLAKRERALFEWMAGYRPDLVIRLAVDLKTASARKPDHRYASLAQKVAAAPRLSFNGAPILELSSLDPLPEVVAAARHAIAAVMTQRYGAPPD